MLVIMMLLSMGYDVWIVGAKTSEFSTKSSMIV